MTTDRSLLSRRRRRGSREGATAVEFAMVAMPLFFMIFSILEIAMVFIVSTTLENAMQQGSREIRVGIAQAEGGGDANVNEAAFRSEVCERMAFLADHCMGHLTVDVRPLESFDDDDAPDPNAGGGFDDSDLIFDPGEENEIILVRGFYTWPLFTPFLEQALGKVDGTTALVTATETFRNEPFGSV